MKRTYTRRPRPDMIASRSGSVPGIVPLTILAMSGRFLITALTSKCRLHAFGPAIAVAAPDEVRG